MQDYSAVKTLFSLKNKILRYFCGFILLISVIFCISCSDSEPKVVASSSYVIFDYPDNLSNPSVRLAVFLETSSDVHRAQKFTLTSRETSFQWLCDEPVIFSNEKRKWAGYTDFVTPEDISLPGGFYDIQYVDSQDRTYNTVVSVNYQEQFEKSTVDELDSLINGKFKENVALYDGENSVLYYGDMKDSWKTEKRIFQAYPAASYYRKCLVLSFSNSILLLPPVYKDDISENDSKNEEISKTEIKDLTNKKVN